MHTAPLHLRLAELQEALAAGHQDLRPLGAVLDRSIGLITLDVGPREPAHFWLRDLATIAQAAAARAGHRAPRIIAPPPVPVAVRAIAPAVPLEKLYCWKDGSWPPKHRPGCAPARAIGNFNTPADAKRTIDALKHNLNEAARSGNAKLIRVMREALDRAMEQ